MVGKVREAWKVSFLRHLRKGTPVSVAAQVTNVGMSKVLNARKLDPDFAKEWSEIDVKTTNVQCG